MAETNGIPQPVAWRPRLQDVAWLLLFAALGLLSPGPTDAEIEILTSLAVFQVVEPRIPWFQNNRGSMLSIAIKLLLCYLLIGVTGGVTSSYYLILMVPVVAAATTLGAWGTFIVSILASASYLSFVLFLDPERYIIPAGELRELGLRVLMIAVLALLMHQLAGATRAQSRQYIETANQLVAANKSLAEAESAVRRSERLAGLGQLTAGLAHELRNPLGTMKASAEVLLKSLPEELAVPRELAGYIREEVDRTSSLVTRFLDFAKPFQLQRAEADINEVIDRAIKRLEVPVVMHRNYSPDVRPFSMDAELLERVFYNLLLNAAQASPQGGEITVKTKPVDKAVEISVIDRGVGIEKAHQENIFNPFFTTKPSGTGLGLAIVSKIVDEHGGKIAVESEPGHGTVFRVLLPTT